MLRKPRANLDTCPYSSAPDASPVGGAATIHLTAMAAFTGGDAGAQAAKIALRIGTNAADAISFAADLGEELPFIGPVLGTLKAIREKVETVKNNREELTALEVRCTYVTACVVVKCRGNPLSEIDVAPLEACVGAVRKFVERCGGRGRVRRVLKASSDMDEIAGLNALVDRVTGALGMAGIAVLEGKADEMKAMLVSFALGYLCLFACRRF